VLTRANKGTSRPPPWKSVDGSVFRFQARTAGQATMLRPAAPQHPVRSTHETDRRIHGMNTAPGFYGQPARGPIPPIDAPETVGDTVLFAREYSRRNPVVGSQATFAIFPDKLRQGPAPAGAARAATARLNGSNKKAAG